MKKIIVGITGASGSLLAKRLIESLIERNIEVHCVITSHGREVFEYELSESFNDFVKALQSPLLNSYSNDSMFAPIASGSFDFDAMLIIPCSMGSLAKIAHGISDNLLARAADVALKEKRPLFIIPRETPLSTLHLRNMLILSELGVTIMPPMPAYYNHPSSLSEITDLTIGRILEKLGIQNEMHKIWKGSL